MSHRRPISAVHLQPWRLLQGVLAASTPWLLLMAAPMPASAATALQATVVRASADTAAAAFDGVVEAVRQTSVATQVPGAIVQILVKAGDRVGAGQVLVRVDAQTASQNAAASDAQVLAARAAVDVAAKDLERQKQLATAHFISPAALERAESLVQASQAQLDAQVAQAGAARSQIGLHTVRAPFAGVVSEVPVALGDMALPGRPLLTLYDPLAMRISVALPQSLAAQVRAAGLLRIEVPGVSPGLAAPGARAPNTAPLTAVRTRILPTADAATHTVTLQADLPASLQGLSPGLFARVWIAASFTASPVDSAVSASSAASPPVPPSVPWTAVVRRAELTAVYVLDAQGQPLLRQVRLGRSNGTQVEVLAGLMAGERVATDPQAAARVR